MFSAWPAGALKRIELPRQTPEMENPIEMFYAYIVVHNENEL